MADLTKAVPISLKAHRDFNEKWLQGLIAEDPSLLGLGDLDLLDIERRQPRAGRLDLLLRDPSAATRYEVEIQLGATDESHIIRAIEYWDIEKNRYPMYDHVAVLVAEDVTSRFLNVISLLNRAVPLVAIQMNAWQVGDHVTLTATKVLDLMPALPDDDESGGQTADRGYWERRVGAQAMKLADAMFEITSDALTDTRLSMKFNFGYIGHFRDGLVDNFIVMRPRKGSNVMLVNFRIPRSDELAARIAEAGLDQVPYDPRYGYYRVQLTPSDLTTHRDLLTELVQRAADVAVGELHPDDDLATSE